MQLSIEQLTTELKTLEKTLNQIHRLNDGDVNRSRFGDIIDALNKQIDEHNAQIAELTDTDEFNNSDLKNLDLTGYETIGHKPFACKKTVHHNGEKIKVEYTQEILFKKHDGQRDEKTKFGYSRQTEIQQWVINGKTYHILYTDTSTYKKCRRHRIKRVDSVRYSFEGFETNDNQKKLIEHIIGKYGL